jgi:predicted phosphodiesterase
MRIAVLSDVHGNLEALREVLADIDRSRTDAVLCLGDNIGYGPEPEAVVESIRERGIPCVMGNHELGLVDETYLDWFNTSARLSLLLTQGLISSDTLAYMRRLQPSLSFQACLGVHGCPPESVTTYLFQVSDADLRMRFRNLEESICFVGHTHDLELIRFDGTEIMRASLCRGKIPLNQDPGQKYIVNVGSVGQPRDGNNNAKYVIWDTALGQLEVKFIPYDIAKTAKKILHLGFPEFNARRLW